MKLKNGKTQNFLAWSSLTIKRRDKGGSTKACDGETWNKRPIKEQPGRSTLRADWRVPHEKSGLVRRQHPWDEGNVGVKNRPWGAMRGK